MASQYVELMESSSGCLQTAHTKLPMIWVSRPQSQDIRLLIYYYCLCCSSAQGMMPFCYLPQLTAGQTVLAEGLSGTRAYGWYTLSLTVKVSNSSNLGFGNTY